MRPWAATIFGYSFLHVILDHAVAVIRFLAPVTCGARTDSHFMKIKGFNPCSCFFCSLNYLLGQQGTVAFFPRTA